MKNQNNKTKKTMDEELEKFGEAMERQQLVERGIFSALAGFMTTETVGAYTRTDITNICVRQAEDVADYIVSMRNNLIPDE